jgi:hypothetical protein
LGRDCASKANKAELQFNAKAAWMAISLFDDTYSIYFGAFESLSSKTDIPMGENHFKRYECLVKEKQHGLDFSPYKNVYEQKVAISESPKAITYRFLRLFGFSAGSMECTNLEL